MSPGKHQTFAPVRVRGLWRNGVPRWLGKGYRRAAMSLPQLRGQSRNPAVALEVRAAAAVALAEAGDWEALEETLAVTADPSLQRLLETLVEEAEEDEDAAEGRGDSPFQFDRG